MKHDYASGGSEDLSGDHGTNGPSSNSGQSQTTKGGVKAGLSEQKEFKSESLHSLGLDNKSGKKNQVPCQPKHDLNTDRGDFTCW